MAKRKIGKRVAKKAVVRKAADRKTAKAAVEAVRIRMYDIGFGDCFLLFIPTSDGVKKVLVDCGSIKKHKKSTAQIVEQVIRDATGDGEEPRIDVVIATHRHRDHVSGFANDAWQGVEVGEVWMPWTEDPSDPQARGIREAQHGFALELEAQLTRLGASQDLLDFAANALSNEAAMETLHSGFKPSPERRRFLPEKPDPDRGVNGRTFQTPALPGVEVFVLGPSRDEAVIRDMDPPSGGAFLRLASLGDRKLGERTAPRPFSENWIRDAPPFDLSAQDKRRIQSFGEDFPEMLAAGLDSAVNGTSLMLVFKIGKAHLLFPGDAQWGTWNAALKDSEWRMLLAKTRFYKVGHHGSHNATPKDFVERTVGDDFWAMIPVTPHGRWKDIPRKPLVEAIERKTDKLARSDDATVRAPFTREGDWWVETSIPID